MCPQVIAPPPFVDLTRNPDSQGAHPQGFIPLSGLNPPRKTSSGHWVLSSWLGEIQAAFPLLASVTAQLEQVGWHIGLYDEAEHVEVLAASRTILIPSYGYDWERLNRHGLFGTLAQLELLKGLRLGWQAERGLLPDVLGLAPPSWLQLNRARAADADLFMLLACYAMRGQRDGHLWRYALAGDLYTVAEHLSCQLAIRPGKAGVEKALASSFIIWHQQAELTTPVDRAALDTIDALAEDVTLPQGRLNVETLIALTTLAPSFSYLDETADDVLRSPSCLHIPDLVAQTHLLQIMEEQNFLAIGPVVLRDADLARRLFPE